MQRLKELRLSIGLTQSELAESLTTTQTTIGKYERDELEPNIATLTKIADFFECSIDYLLGREDDFGNVNVPLQRFDLTQEETELLEDYRSLSPALQEMLRATIETWKGSKANVSKKHNIRKN